MKILLFGKDGQVGWELNRSLLPLGDVIAVGREDADFSRPEDLREIIQEIKPDVIVNAVAYTAVDKAESEEKLAFVINSESPKVLAEEALKTNTLLVHYSTDYVFDGAKKSAYIETDEPCPINAYGRTKLAGEQVIQSSGCDYLIFRTSWVYASRGRNFLMTIFKLAHERDELSIVSDQIGSPTSARLIAETTFLCVKQAMKKRREDVFSSGLYHLVAADYASWHDFAKEIVKRLTEKADLKLTVNNVREIPSADYPTPAKRPKNSRLALQNLENVFGVKMPEWRHELSLCMEELVDE